MSAPENFDPYLGNVKKSINNNIAWMTAQHEDITIFDLLNFLMAIMKFVFIKNKEFLKFAEELTNKEGLPRHRLQK